MLGLSCRAGPPQSLDLLAALGRGPNARVVQWTVTRDFVTNTWRRSVVDPQTSVPVGRAGSSLTPGEWERVVRQLDFPPEPDPAALALWRDQPVRVVWRRRCQGQADEGLELVIDGVRTRANVRLFAAALTVISAAATMAAEPDAGPN